MPSDAYALIWDAVRRRQQVIFHYRDHRRECCPVILGYAADGREALFAYQFAGSTSKSSKLPQWRCFHIEGISDLQSRSGGWLEGTSHKQEQRCVQCIDVDVNIPDTLNRDAPLPFGSPELRRPRHG